LFKEIKLLQANIFKNYSSPDHFNQKINLNATITALVLYQIGLIAVFKCII